MVSALTSILTDIFSSEISVLLPTATAMVVDIAFDRERNLLRFSSSKMTTPTSMNSPINPKPHFVLVPFMAQGHTIPMIDMAHLLADRGALVTLITTPANAARIQPLIDRVTTSGLSIRFVPLPFPSTEVGLPQGCENVDALPSRDQLKSFTDACALLRDPLLHHLRHHPPAPSCIISDAWHPWTREVALEFGIPRLTFNGFGCFALLVRHIIYHRKILDDVVHENEPFVVPGLPHPIEITKAQAPGSSFLSGMMGFYDTMMRVEATADGVLVNSFDDLEPSCREWYQRAIGKKVWMIGPMLLYNRETDDMAVRGNRASIDEDRCLSWLDSMKQGSVVYASFGSLARTKPSQLIEIGLGLEASNYPFIWVIKAGDKSSEVEEWLSQGFEERTRERGLVIRGWAPQVMILSHPAVGGFMTHCGWNSTLEGVSAGVPMITWPHFAEQFVNEKLIVEILGIGVAVGAKTVTRWGVENTDVSVQRDEVEKVVLRLMGGGDEGEETRKRAREMGEKARKAMKGGGSSYENMKLLIQQINSSNMQTE